MRRRSDRWIWGAALIAGVGWAAGLEANEGEAFFESRVRPVFAEHCYGCHSAGAEKLKAELRLDSAAGIMKGGESGVVVVPGEPDRSLLIRAVRYEEESLEMPPKKKLPAGVVDVLVEWVAMGAPVPDDGLVAEVEVAPFDFEKFRREHWAFRPVVKPSPPAVRDADWGRGAIDRFVLAKLEEAGMAPAPRAERRTLIRRAYLDLTGLPPEPEEVEAFLEDEDPKAFEKVVDRLLESPHYGERWGRHWLDVARYSDGMGGFLDGKDLPDAWRYRDWVVDALNRDLPYDAFVREQIAGDLLDDGEGKVGTGFFAVGPTYISDGGDPEARAQAEAETLADRVDTFSRAFVGLTVACARCHDHKFDPVTIEDYYALAGIFRNSRTVEHPLVEAAVVEVYNAGQQRIRDREKAINQWLDGKSKELGIERGKVEREMGEALKAELAEMRKGVEAEKKAAPAKYEVAHGIGETGNGDMHVAIRGDLRKKGELVKRRFLEVIAGTDAEGFNEGSGRRALAEAVVAPGNPLTARVMVNRIWLGHFGKALVRSPSNFGMLGEEPTHPGLLDWLAATFVEKGWSMKALHREIVLSATWQMDSRYREDAFEQDGDNRLIWRTNPRRLEVEAWRDSLLAVTGELERTLGGRPTDRILESKRRTLYAKISRNGDRFLSDEFLRIFDFPTPRSTSPARVESTVPQQFLFVLNSPFMVARAKALAERVGREADEGETARIRRAYALLLAREPSEREVEVGLAYLGEAAGEGEPPRWESYAQVLLGTQELMQMP